MHQFSKPYPTLCISLVNPILNDVLVLISHTIWSIYFTTSTSSTTSTMHTASL